VDVLQRKGWMVWSNGKNWIGDSSGRWGCATSSYGIQAYAWFVMKGGGKTQLRYVTEKLVFSVWQRG
jgi:hypothetical protein